MSGGEAVVESLEAFVLVLDKDAWTLTLHTPSLSLVLAFKVLEVNQLIAKMHMRISELVYQIIPLITSGLS